MLFLINTSLSRLLPLRLFLFLIHAFPAIEKVLSTGAKEAGTTSKSHANLESTGNSDSDLTSGGLLFLCWMNKSTSCSSEV